MSRFIVRIPPAPGVHEYILTRVLESSGSTDGTAEVEKVGKTSGERTIAEREQHVAQP